MLNVAPQNKTKKLFHNCDGEQKRDTLVLYRCHHPELRPKASVLNSKGQLPEIFTQNNPEKSDFEIWIRDFGLGILGWKVDLG